MDRRPASPALKTAMTMSTAAVVVAPQVSLRMMAPYGQSRKYDREVAEGEVTHQEPHKVLFLGGRGWREGGRGEDSRCVNGCGGVGGLRSWGNWHAFLPASAAG